MLLTQGIVVFDACSESADRQLDELITSDGRRLGLRLKDEILSEIGRLWLVMEQLAHVDDVRHIVALPRRFSACDGARDHDDADVAMIAALAPIRGVGPNDASVLVREALWRKFANRREIVASSGFAPRRLGPAARSASTRASPRPAPIASEPILYDPTLLALAAMAAPEPARWGSANGRTAHPADDAGCSNRKKGEPARCRPCSMTFSPGRLSTPPLRHRRRRRSRVSLSTEPAQALRMLETWVGDYGFAGRASPRSEKRERPGRVKPGDNQ